MEKNRRTVLRWTAGLLFAALPLFADDVANTLQPYLDRNCFAGAVVVLVGPEGIVSEHHAGYVDLKTKRPIGINTLFQLASITKPFTATAILQLADRGKISLDDPVGKYIPEMQTMFISNNPADKNGSLKKAEKPITIRHLLSNTSGLPFLPEAQRKDISGIPLKEMVMANASMKLLFEPGTRFSYSNAGYNTLGRIVEIASGKPYEVYLAKNLFEPLGMKDTTFFPNAEQRARLAVMYKADPLKNGLLESPFALLGRPLNSPDRFAEAGAGLFSTPDDLARFAEMLVNRGYFRGKRLLSEKMFCEMTKVQTPPSEKKWPYGFGFHIRENCFFHGGAGGSDLKVYKNRPLAFLWFTQQYFCTYAGNGAEAENAVEKILLGSEAVKPEEKRVDKDPRRDAER